ncbi:SET domain-containing protein [Nemania sp. NC0429]|nr:SET domain-containing protein [Nemania sp. NC0429]
MLCQALLSVFEPHLIEPVPSYILQDVPGKGKGLTAVSPIARGTRILCEKPLITSTSRQTDLGQLKAAIRRQIKSLSEDQRQTFLSLHNIHPYNNLDEQYLGIFRTNALPIEDDGVEGGIFVEGSRVNHACDNNAQKHWNERIKRHTVHAIRDIAVGEEITITYLGSLRSRKTRQENLQAKFGFRCLCALCSLPEEQSKQVDDRLEQIYYLDQVIGFQGLAGISAKPLKMLRLIDRQVCLYNEHGPNDVGLPRAFLDASQVLLAHDDLARARVFIQRAISEWESTQGADSASVLEYRHLLDDPSKHQLHGITKKWATTIDQAPQGLSPDEFEDWLWRRDRPMREGKPADFHHGAYFPVFAELPNDRELDLDFFDFNMGDKAGQPRRHWCFLGEIVEFGYLMRLQMEVKGRNGAKVPLFFYTEDRGEELMESLRTGQVVAILYAKSHAFMDGQFGIRLEDAALVKVRDPCPFSYLDNRDS